jgi:hypothetical protein
MSENKTQPTDAAVGEFIDQVTHEVRREDAWRLLELHKEVTGHEPVMWGPSIIGFDSYHYRYASGREGDAPAAGFSPRSASQTLYVTFEFDGCADLLARLGKHKTSKACLYINKLDDVDMDVLRVIVENSYRHTKQFFDDRSS